MGVLGFFKLLGNGRKNSILFRGIICYENFNCLERIHQFSFILYTLVSFFFFFGFLERIHFNFLRPVFVFFDTRISNNFVCLHNLYKQWKRTGKTIITTFGAFLGFPCR